MEKEGVKIGKLVVKQIYKKKHLIRSNKRMLALAQVSILGGNNGSIDSIVFVKISGGCGQFPKMNETDLSKGIYKVIKNKKDVLGLVLVHKYCSYKDDYYNYLGSCFRNMIAGRGWSSDKFVYIVCGLNELFSWKLRKGRKGWRDNDYKKVRLAYV